MEYHFLFSLLEPQQPRIQYSTGSAAEPGISFDLRVFIVNHSKFCKWALEMGKKTSLFHLYLGIPTQCCLGRVSDGVKQQRKYSTDFLQGFNELTVLRHYTSLNDLMKNNPAKEYAVEILSVIKCIWKNKSQSTRRYSTSR